MRGDTEPILIGAHTNLQEGVIVHVDPGFPVTVGAGVTVGHGAILHGATVGNNIVVGMGAIILNGANIGEDSIVGAGALVTERKTFPPRSLVLGNPAKLVRGLTPDEIERNRRSAATYTARAQAFKNAILSQSGMELGDSKFGQP